MSLMECIKFYLAVKKDCKERYKRDLRNRMRELIEAYRMEI